MTNLATNLTAAAHRHPDRVAVHLDDELLTHRDLVTEATVGQAGAVSSSLEVAARQDTDTAVILYTSGTNRDTEGRATDACEPTRKRGAHRIGSARPGRA